MPDVSISDKKFKYILTCGKDELSIHRDAVLELFADTFNRDLPLEFWRWQYMRGIYGSPIVSLCYDKNILVGHHAAIPFFLEMGGKKVKTVLTCTTMVKKNYRRYGIFYNLVELLLQKIRAEKYDLVIGFPNQNSAEIFKGFFDYKTEKSYIAKLDRAQIRNLALKFRDKKILRLDLSNPDYLSWRLSKPGEKYFYAGDNILKRYGNDLELVYFDEFSADQLAGDLTYKVLVNEDAGDLRDFRMFDYSFHYKPINADLNFDAIKKDLLMSDVF